MAVDGAIVVCCVGSSGLEVEKLSAMGFTRQTSLMISLRNRGDKRYHVVATPFPPREVDDYLAAKVLAWSIDDIVCVSMSYISFHPNSTIPLLDNSLTELVANLQHARMPRGTVLFSSFNFNTASSLAIFAAGVVLT